jgi:hypothetical protein
MIKKENPKMKNSEKGKRNGTISALIERHYHAGTRLVVALVLALTVASVVAAQAPILHLYLPVILKTSGSTDNSGVPAAQQPPLDCGNLRPDASHGEKIKCKSKELIDEVCNTVDLMSQDDLGILPLAQQNAMTNTCIFATDIVSATNPAEFQTFGIKRSAEGVAEYVGPDDPNQGYEDDGDSDGVCLLKKGGPNQQNCNDPNGCKPKKYEEWCAEVITDGIGDDDGFCEWQGKGKNSYLEPCVPLSDAAAIDSQEENFNEEKLVAVEDALDANIDAMKAVNIQLAADLEELRTLRATSAETFKEYKPKECLGLMQVPDYLPQDRAHYGVLYGFLVAMDSMAGGHDACDAAANQDVLGNNGSAVCVATAVLKAMAVGVFDVLELIDDTITATRLDNAVQCLETVKKGLDEANDKLDKMLKVDLQVTELKEKSEFLVGATVGGNPASGVEFISVKVADSSISFLDVTGYMNYKEVDPGMYRVVIDLPQEAKNAQVFAFQVKHHTKVGEEDLELFGFTHFHRGTQ